MDQPTAWERFFPDKPPGTATTVSHPVEEDGGDFFDLNAWVDFALTNPSEIPLLAASQLEKPSDNDDSSKSNMPSHSGNLELDHSHKNLPGNGGTQSLYPMVQMATMVGLFLTLNSGLQPELLNLHPVPIDSVQTFVLPNGIDSANVPRHVTKASSSRTLLVENGGGFDEIVVDMTVTARRNPVSTARGRNGPLSKESRAAMKLLKDVGACWHCRFTGKKCDIKNPCDSCPKTRPTPWRTVGCRRGTLQNASSPVVLCPSGDFEARSITHDLEEVALGAEPNLAAAQTANDCLLEWARQREHLLESIKCLDTFLESESGQRSFMEVCQEVFARFETVCISDGSTPTSGKEIAEAGLLRDTVIAILWELQDYSTSLGAVSKGHILHAMTLSDLRALLCSAALYQIQEDTYQLIKESLLCLQACLEAARVQSSCTLTRAAHHDCSPSSCKIDCLSKLDANLKTYLDLLSKILFKKNSKNCRDWWLSVFYSLCIQSYVRKLLTTLISHPSPEEDAEQMGASSTTSQYLHLAVELFAACNDTGKKYDPLSYNLDDLSTSEASVTRIHSLDFEHAKLAQIAVKQPSWAQKHIDGSYAYLREQFEVLGGVSIPPASKKRRYRELMDHSGPNSDQFMEEIESRFQGRQKKAPFQGPLQISQSSEDANLDHFLDNDLEDSDVLGLLHNQTKLPPPTEDLNLLNDLRNTREQKPRFEGDLYNPRWVRDFKMEGWCGLCKPGHWISMKEAWWNDRVLFHGICAETGKKFPEPVVEVEVDADTQTWKGQCGKCKTWVTFKIGDMRHYSAWHVHSANCYDENFTSVEDPVIEELSEEL